MKVGRNDPCPCGSGKKYKKCCLEKDEEIALYSNEPKEDEWEPEDELDDENCDEDSYIQELDEESVLDDETEFSEISDEESALDDETELSEISDDESALDDETELPEISDDEMKLVDDWWDEYKKMQDTVKEREHLIAFIDRYPHLVDHLELDYEVLFELGGDHFENNIYEIFVELLLRIRKEFPVTYKKSFKYYDSDLIYWFTAQGRLDEIDEFFNYFKEEGKYNEKIEDLMVFFHAINRSDILLKLLVGTKYTEHLSFIISSNIMQRYIDKPVTDESIQSLLDEIVLEGIADEECTKENMKKRLLDYTRPFTPWADHLPKKRSQTEIYFFKICLNFTYFLYKNTGLSLSSARIISDFVHNYYERIIYRDNKRPVDIFCLDKKSILENTIKYYDTMLWGYDISCFIELNALYHFVSYLKTCGNISEERKNELQVMITSVYQEVYNVSKDQGPEMLLFNEFPLQRCFFTAET